MKKMWFVLVLVVMMVMTVTAQAQKGGNCGKNLTWELNDEGLLTISGTGPMEVGKRPWEYYDYTAVNIMPGVTTISNYAFAGDTLTRVTIPGSVTEIGEGAFDNCGNLVSVTLSEGLTSIGKSAFAHCESLESVAIPESVKEIGAYAFLACTNLKKVTLPEGLKSIGRAAFSNCKSLMSINLPKEWTVIADELFILCESLANVVIPNGVTRIGTKAFWGCNSLVELELPYGIKDIGDNAFAYCWKLTSITLPETLTNIGAHAFENCSFKRIVIPGNVVKIGDEAFYGSDLETVTISEGVTSIGSYAFGDCALLRTAVVPASVTFIGEKGFSREVFDLGGHHYNYVTCHVLDGSYAHKWCVEKEVEYKVIDGTLPGDVDKNGSVTLADVQAILSGNVSSEANADVNGDGNVNEKDVLRIMQYISGWDVTLQ